MKFNNIRPSGADKFIVNRGWIFVNRSGTHATYMKIINGKETFCQIICNSKTIYWKNMKELIRKSQIPEKEWVEEFT